MRTTKLRLLVAASLFVSGCSDVDLFPKSAGGPSSGSGNEFSLSNTAAYGINAHRPTGEEANRLFDKVREAGISWVRIDVVWAETEREKGVFQWDENDQAIRAATDRGLLVFANLNTAPGWSNGGRSRKILPKNSADWANFCREVAVRYDGNHGQPKVNVFGMWNEPDGGGMGEESDSMDKRVGDYVNTILRPGYKAIHDVRADVRIAAPDLASETEFLSKMLSQAKDSVDVVTVHKYSDFASGIIKYLDEVRSIMKGKGVDSKPLWLTETGWARNCFINEVKDDATQASRYTSLLNELWSRDWIKKVFFYELRDPESGCTWGILRRDYSEKPAYRAYRDFISAHPSGIPKPPPTPTAPPTPARGTPGVATPETSLPFTDLTPGNDVFDGTNGPDNIRGLAGDDSIRGMDGDDFINGNEGNDQVNGNQGNDVVHGGQGDDILNGGAGNDKLYGGWGNDALTGGLGDDVLEGGEGNDRYIYVYAAGSGADVLFDSSGNDSLECPGLEGQKVTFSQSGNDLLLLLPNGGRITIRGQFSGNSVENINCGVR